MNHENPMLDRLRIFCRIALRGRYTHVLKGQRRSAIESLPDFTKRKATGTDKNLA